MTGFLGRLAVAIAVGVNPAGGCRGRNIGRHRRSARSQFAAVRPGRVLTLRDQCAAVRPQLVAQRLDR